MSIDKISSEARLQILEISVAALIAQLPQSALEEVIGLLTYVAGISDEAAHVAGSDAAISCGHVRHWAEEMVERIVTSRKSGRSKDEAADDPTKLRYTNAVPRNRGPG